jgi:hypothetical protein
MDIFIGITLALAVSVLAALVGFDRDRAFYPVVMVVIASYYALFAVMGGSLQALAAETVAMGVFVLAAILGFRKNLWLVVAALAAHGVFDFFHGHLIDNPGVPAWWPTFCLAYDGVAAGFLAWLLRRGRLSAQNSGT